MDTNFLQNLQDALVITVIGMGSVLLFLGIMIWSMNGMKIVLDFINKLFPPEIQETSSIKDKRQVAQEEEIAIAIAAILARENKI